MAYGNYGGRSYGNGGGYNRGGYANNNGGGYANQQPAPAPAPIDVHQEIVTRIELYNQFKSVATNELGIPADEFLMMAPMLGGWVTSILLKQEKGK